MKNIDHWIKRIKEDIYEPDKLIIDIEYLKKQLKAENKKLKQEVISLQKRYDVLRVELAHEKTKDSILKFKEER